MDPVEHARKNLGQFKDDIEFFKCFGTGFFKFVECHWVGIVKYDMGDQTLSTVHIFYMIFYTMGVDENR